ncbi:MAG: DUF1365 domain-containing protein [Gammaproteobacteria bacterium]|nr:DUF1365 domain-containing protein [Gammaproteobacteria bacterium]
MKSCIYTGQVRHRRFAPRIHEFSYRLFMMYVDLAELPSLFDKHWFWSGKKFALAWFRREDHYGKPGVKLDESIRQLVQKETGNRPRGPIRLLTHFRYFGYCFNPVSFYYCFDETDNRVETIVAEVNNTPWRDQYCYVLTEKRNQGTRRNKRYRFGKDFHVSPFMDMNIDYDWRFIQPDERLSVHMENLQMKNGISRKIFDATMTMKRQPITAMNLAKTLAMYPFMTAKVTAAIYYQALKLWLKKIPFYPHPGYKADNLTNQSTVREL